MINWSPYPCESNRKKKKKLKLYYLHYLRTKDKVMNTNAG